MAYIKLIANKLWAWKWNITTVLLSLFAPAVAYCMMESFVNKYTDMNREILIFNLLFVYLLWAFIFFATWSPRWSTASVVLILAIIGTLEYAVLSFRSVPIQPWDLLSVGTGLSVVGNYKFVFTERVIWLLVSYAIMLALIILGCRTKLKKQKIVVRIACLLICVVLGTGYTKIAQSTNFQTKVGYYPYLFTPTVVYKNNGFFFSFISLLKYLDISAPEGYSVQELRETAEQYGGEGTGENDEDKPNLILIMNESFSDVTVLGDFNAETDYEPFIPTLTENTIKGQAYVSVKGGNTPNSEFEFLTGDTMAFLPSGSIPYQQYLTSETDNFITNLKKQGYNTVAMHPYNATGWKRNTVYPLLGFDNSFFLPYFSGMERVRNYISDKSVYDKIIRQYSENLTTGKPFATFCVTMQNHGGYTNSHKFDNFDLTVSVSGVKYNQSLIATYMSLVQLSDASFKYLVDYFSGIREKTLIVMFGDHQPNSSITKYILLANGIEEETEDWNVRKNQFVVPFVIWANYDIEEQEDIVTSLNYLNILVSEAAGLELTGYQKFRKEIMEKYPVVTANFCIDKDGNLITRSDMEKRGMLSEYEKFQYNHIFDTKHTVEDFFD